MKTNFIFKIYLLVFALLFDTLSSIGQTYTFTHAGASGINGPTQAQINTAYGSTNLANNVTVNGGIQTWMIPVSGVYKIEVIGANGYGPFAGKGAYMSGQFTFNASDQLKILVGQKGGCCVSSGTEQYGGGGGTFVVDGANLPLIIAGGGGGANGNTTILPNSNASITTSGNVGVGSTGGAGGTNGSGGAGASSAGGGGGFSGDGGVTAGNPGGFSFLNGGVGGTATTSSGGWGGFGGGGGANSWNNKRGGGGGGYSGGGGAGSSSSAQQVGGGGGSYNIGTNQVNTPALGTGDGQVIITLLAPAVSVPNNAGVVAFPSLSAGACPGLQTITAKVRNFGNNAMDSVKVAWEVNGVLQSNNWYQVNLDTFPVLNYDTTITLGTYSFGPGSFDIKAWTSLPNNQNDTVNINDTSSITLVTKLAGTYTINSALPTAGANYQNFSDFTAALNTYGICGPVIANVSGGPFVETLGFGDVDGASSINTIRINGNGATVQFSNTTTDRQLLKLSGTKYLTIDSLTFKSLSTTYGWGALITGGAAHDSIINCFFDLTSVTSTSSANTNGITFSSSSTSATSTGANGSHSYIGNNHIKWSDALGGGYYALTLAGACDSNVIENNIFENFYYYGTYINGATGVKILNNEYHKENKTGSLTTFYGIYSTGLTPGLRVIGNRIHHPGGMNGSSGTFYGLYMLGDGTASEPILIANNALYELNQNGLVRGIYLSTSPYSLVYHNTVVFDKVLTSSSTMYGIYAAGTNTNTEIKNNNVVITAGNTGTKYGFYYSSSSSISDAQKNNFYVNSTQSGTQYYGYLSSNYNTQAAFQTANPLYEIGSPATNPLFVNPLVGDFNVQSPLLIGSGENLQSYVPLDINGNPRPVTPTIGAYERPPIGNNNAGSIAFITPSGTYCAGSQSVSISINNAGVNNISNLKIDWTVNGVAQAQVSYTGTLVPITSVGSNTDTVVLGNANIPSGTSTIIKAWTTLPNGAVDTVNNNDTVQLSFQASEFNIVVIADSICVGADALLSLTPNTGYSVGDIEWQYSANGINWTSIPNSDDVQYTETNLTSSKFFRVKIGSGTNICYSDSAQIAVIPVVIPTVSDGEHCGPGTVDLSAIAVAGNNLNWYENETGGLSLSSGGTFTTPYLLETDTFYVASGVGGGQLPPTFIGSGTNTTSSTPSPYYNLYDGYKAEYLIQASELMAAGFSAGLITEIGFDVVGSGSAPLLDFSIKMGATSATTLTTGAWQTGMTQVYSIPSLTTTANTVNTYTFTTPFAWDGVSNVVIQTCYYNGTWGGTYASVKYTTGLSFNATHYVNQDNNPTICTQAGITGYEYTVTSRPNIQFTMITGCESLRIPVIARINPVPDVDLGSDFNECVDSGTNFTLDAGSFPHSPTYLWDNNTTSQTRGVNSTGSYSVAVTNSYGCVGNDTVNVTLRNNPKVDLGNDTSVCEGIVLTLDAGNDGISYFWNTGQVSNTIDVDQSGTYTVIVTNNIGCTKTDTIDVTMSGHIPIIDGITVTNIGPKTFQFQVVNPQYAVSYDWDFGDGSAHSSMLNPTHTYPNASNYLVKVKILGTCGEVIDSVNIFIVGLGDISSGKSELFVYPNPSTGNAKIINNGNAQMEMITVYNVLGQKVYSKIADNPKVHEMSLTGLASGIYTVQIKTTEGTVSQRLEIVK